MENKTTNDPPKLDESRSKSISTKMLLLLAIALFIFGFSAAAISYKVYMDASIEQHKRLGTGISNLVADTVDPNRVNEYLSNGKASKGYAETERMLYRIRESSPDIKFVYVYQIREDGCHVVFDLDTSDFEGAQPGYVEEFDEKICTATSQR